MQYEANTADEYIAQIPKTIAYVMMAIFGYKMLFRKA